MTPSRAGTGQRRNLGSDIASAVFLIVLELLGLAAVFFLWVLANLSFGPPSTDPTPVWGYLVAAGVLAALMTWASLRASRRNAGVTAVTQALMAMGTAVLILAGAYYQHREDTPPPPSPCLQSPSAPWCNG
ncbi:DUF6234 family protein [Streptomyces sp. NBC_01408]|uniref:DUF6234 family protein n=1 Tax=Streptomyces sp. NBC_01408 TaxID=2903855 RepID=UPI00224FDED9|nr:DUF6234 family protein [Streptomyces sp. NBC_01408]MCX4693941.1 FTR1 family protein [Streptomyces sp. NBC_01408]